MPRTRNVVGTLAAISVFCFADLPAATTRGAEGPLAGLAATPGPHIEKIQALSDDEWLALGSPRPDPKWGKARGRSWSSNMPAAPDLRGAFVFAEGVHAYVKPDGHYMNDLWFYDINGHRWICLYPGIDVKAIAGQIKDRELTVDDHGVLVDKGGEPLPPLLIHAYGYLGYDPDRKKFVTFGGQFANYFTTGPRGVFETANRLFEEERKGKKRARLSPFFYDVATGRFECFPVEVAPEGQPYGADMLVYAAGRKQFFYGGADGVWFFDPEKRTWAPTSVTGEPPRGIDHCAVYDARRDCIYFLGNSEKEAGDNFHVYDIRAAAWRKPRAKGPGPLATSSYESICHFDQASDRLVVIRLYEKEGPGLARGVYAYDPSANTWTDRLPIPDRVVRSIRDGNYGFHDPVLDVTFCHFAGDSADDGTMWAYRYRKVR